LTYSWNSSNFFVAVIWCTVFFFSGTPNAPLLACSYRDVQGEPDRGINVQGDGKQMSACTRQWFRYYKLINWLNAKVVVRAGVYVLLIRIWETPSSNPSQDRQSDGVD
jgi:hypothetical protein